MVVDEPSGRVFVSVADHVDTLDAITGKLLHSASVSTAIIPSTGQTINHPLAVDRRSGHVFVAGAKAVTILNARTGVIMPSIPLAAPPLTIVVDEHIGRAYVVDRTALTTITTTAGRILHHAHITLPGFDNADLEPLILVDDQTKRVFVGVHPVSVSYDAAMGLDTAPLHVSVLDAETGALQHTTPIPTHTASDHYNDFADMVLDERTGMVFVCVSDDDGRVFVHVLDARSGRVRKVTRVAP